MDFIDFESKFSDIMISLFQNENTNTNPFHESRYSLTRIKQTCLQQIHTYNEVSFIPLILKTKYI